MVLTSQDLFQPEGSSVRESVLPARQFAAAANVDREFVLTLQTMLDTNECITVRAAVRHMKSCSQASTITRDPWRRGEVEAFQAEQKRLREMSGRWEKTSRGDLGVRAEVDQAKLEALGSENEILRAGLVALLRSVGEEGGLQRWRRFFSTYDEAFRAMRVPQAAPAAKIIPLSDKRLGRATKRERP